MSLLLETRTKMLITLGSIPMWALILVFLTDPTYKLPFPWNILVTVYGFAYIIIGVFGIFASSRRLN